MFLSYGDAIVRLSLLIRLMLNVIKYCLKKSDILLEHYILLSHHM